MQTQKQYTNEQKLNVWKKGSVVLWLDPNNFRLDQCWALIQWGLYWNRDSQNNAGREIDHITPESNWGKDDLSNLRPLQWYNNVTKSDGRLTCPVKRT